MKTCRVCGLMKSSEEYSLREGARGKNATTCKRCIRNFHYLRRYGITVDEYETWYKELKGYCPLCKKWYKRLAVDHNHKTGEVRGLLCISCNRVLGYFEDKKWKKRAKKYLS
jgi:hypothetical protein